MELQSMWNLLNPMNWFRQGRTVDLTTYNYAVDEYSEYQPVDPLAKYSWASGFDLTGR